MKRCEKCGYLNFLTILNGKEQRVCEKCGDILDGQAECFPDAATVVDESAVIIVDDDVCDGG